MGLIGHYLRVFFRSHTRPINKKIAYRGELTSSVLYFLSAWTAFGAAIYYYTQNYDKVKDSPYAGGNVYTPYDTVRKFGLESKPATVYHIRGFSIEKETVERDDPKLAPL